MEETPVLVAGRYRLDSLLGRGGMGKVWKAHDEKLARRVAVKEVHWPAGIPADERAVLLERTMREARFTARLNHPGVVTIYDVVSHDGRPFIVMELLDALSLGDAVAEHGSLPAARVAQIGLEILSALDAAHEEGVVHRDVKPNNVMLRGDGRVVLTDFGIASSDSDVNLTSTGLLVGSPSYMSPERLRGGGIAPPADMWSLGATLYAAANGTPPFRADNAMGTITAVLADPIPPPGVQGPLHDAIMGLLDKDPATRLTSAQARPLLQAAVHSAESADPSSTMSLVAPEPSRRSASQEFSAIGPSSENTDADAHTGTGSDSDTEPARRRSRTPPVLAILAVLVLAGVLAGNALLGGDDSEADPDTPDSTVPAPFESATLYEFARYLFEPDECFVPEPGEYPVAEVEPDIELVKCISDEVPYSGTFWCKITPQELQADRRVYLDNAVDGTRQSVTEPPAGQDEVADGKQVAFNHAGGDDGRVYWDSEEQLCAGELQADGDDGLAATIDYWLTGRAS